MSTNLEDNSDLQILADKKEDYVQSDLLRNVGPKLSLKCQYLIYSLYKRGSTFPALESFQPWFMRQNIPAPQLESCSGNQLPSPDTLKL